MKKIQTILALTLLVACTKESKKDATTTTCITNPMKGTWYFYAGESATTFAWDSEMIIDSISTDSFTATFPKYNLRNGDTIIFSSKAGLCNNKNFSYKGHLAYEKMEIKVSYYGASSDTLVDSFYYDGIYNYAKFFRKIK